MLNAVRKELRRFEKRRLRPVLHMFRRSSSRISAGSETTAQSASLADSALEQLLVAMLREQVRGVKPGIARTARPSGTDPCELDSFVRGMLAARPHDGPDSSFPEAA